MERIAFESAVAMAALAMIAIGSNALRRRRVREPAELESNCLLTKMPVEFWTGPRSFFYFRHYWNGLPVFLWAHGYDVRLIPLPWRNTRARRAFAEAKLRQGPRHLVLDRATAAEFADLLRLHPPLSLTIPPADRTERLTDRFVLGLHRIFLRLSGFRGPLPDGGELGLGRHEGEGAKRTLLKELRRHAEGDWLPVVGPDFPLESPESP